jgi:hypothetical protein
VVGRGRALAEHRGHVQVVAGRGDQVAAGLHFGLADGEVVSGEA